MKLKNLVLYCLILFVSQEVFSQSPSGIKGHKLWLNSVVTDGAGIKKIKSANNISTTHFNFNPVLDLHANTRKSYKNIIGEQYSLFAVFKSDFEEERLLISLVRGKTKVLISNKQVLSNKEIIYNRVDSRKGFILSYSNANNERYGKKSNRFIIDDLFAQDEEGREQLMELIYYPTFLDDDSRQKIETYLSLKYGISILGDFNYLDSDAEKIWDVKKNRAYNTRVTGIGRMILTAYIRNNPATLKKMVFTLVSG